MGSYSVEPPKPWIETPCLYSGTVSKAAGCNIFLKLENLQPSGSFKSRGIGNMMQKALKASGVPQVHYYISSGGNAGLACATSGQALDCPVTVVVPTITPAFMVQKLRDLGATVVQTGANWPEADSYLRTELLAKDPAGVYVSPFDHPDIWAGASTMVDEIAAQVSHVDGVVCNVGGGGLLSGIMEGIERVYSGPDADLAPHVLAVETAGADSLNASVRAGELVTLPAMTSIAISLGATRVAARAFEWAQRKGDLKAGRLISAVVSDADAVMGSARLLDDARLLVEVSCGATISMAYNGGLRRHLGEGMSDAEWARQNIVLVVCGGSLMNLAALQEFKLKYGV